MTKLANAPNKNPIYFKFYQVDDFNRIFESSTENYSVKLIFKKPLKNSKKGEFKICSFERWACLNFDVMSVDGSTILNENSEQHYLGTQFKSYYNG